MLELRGVGWSLPGKPILSEIDLTLEPNEICVLLGPSGSGKTSLLRVIAGLAQPQQGQVLWAGTDLTHTPTYRRRFGLMFQNYALFPHLSVGENVGFGLKMLGESREAIDASVRKSLAWVNLAERIQDPVTDLSGGEQQRVALARTLASRPRLVMLDEPLASLDQHLRARLLTDTIQLLRSQQLPALYVTHDQQEAKTVGDRIAVLVEGQIRGLGTWEKLTCTPGPSSVVDFLSH